MALSPSILRPVRRLCRAWLTRAVLSSVLVAAGAAASAQTTADTPPAGYTRCASEGQTCSFSGTANVVYGARSTWSSPRSYTGGTACGNAVFGDPLYGVPKACYYQAGATPAPAGDAPAGYTLCASEGQTCSFSSQADVVYGARGTWSNPRSFTGGTACSNAVFGDPLYGVPKACYQRAAATTPFSLMVTASAGGSVNSSPGGIQCAGATCSAAFAQGSSVALTATPAAGYAFSGWGGACSGTAGCSVKMDAAKSVSASFAPTVSPNAKTLTNSMSGNGSIGISDGASSSACTATCTKTFTTGANLVLAATPAAGHSFAGWGGACSGTGGCTVKMDAAKSVTAAFNAVATGGPLVKWEAPATMANGSPAAGLTGFKVYGSKTRYDLAPTLLLTVANPAAVSATVPGLASGTWYFWVSATTSATESELHYNSQALVP
jgi:hypothetical protein